MSELNYEMISQYLGGELSGEALITFEKEIASNPALAKEISLYKTIDEEMPFRLKHQEEKKNLSATLRRFNEAYFNKPVAKVKNITRWWYAAGAVAAAAILIFIFKPFSSQTFNNEQLFANYIKDVEDLPGSQRGSNDTVLLNAISLYNKKDYVNTLPLLQNILTNKPGETELVLATGICYLQTGKYDTAINVFNKIVDGASVFKNKATWYKALTYLKQDKREECYKILAMLPVDADNFKEAKELMNKIESQRK